MSRLRPVPSKPDHGDDTPSAPEDWTDIACREPEDPLDDFVGALGRDAFADERVADSRIGRALAHAGLSTRWPV